MLSLREKVGSVLTNSDTDAIELLGGILLISWGTCCVVFDPMGHFPRFYAFAAFAFASSVALGVSGVVLGVLSLANPLIDAAARFRALTSALIAAYWFLLWTSFALMPTVSLATYGVFWLAHLWVTIAQWGRGQGKWS